MISRDKIAFRTDLKLILNMDSSIDKDNIKGETNVLTRKRIVGLCYIIYLFYLYFPSRLQVFATLGVYAICFF